METGSTQGQLLLNTSLVDLLKSGRIDLETAMFASYNPIDLEKTLKRNGF
jgi:Tfp pilus assembly pilus retraction ATPase PilT